MSGINNLAYWAHSQVRKKVKCCEYNFRVVFTTINLLYNIQMGPISLCNITLVCKDFPGTNILAYCAHLQVRKELKCCKYNFRGCIQNTWFTLQLRTGPSKQKCNITLGWKFFPSTNTLALALALAQKARVFVNWKPSSLVSWDTNNNISFYSELMNGPNKLECLSNKSISRIVPWDTQAIAFHFIPNLWMGPISYSVFLMKAFPA
jgi:hypothetical protein